MSSVNLAARSRNLISIETPPRNIKFEAEWLLLVFLVLGIYFTRIGALTVRGEESRWARVAIEMLDTGDWIVPRQQGEPFPDRPPLNSWGMILASKLTGSVDRIAIRIPSVIATLLTTLVIYGYSRHFLSRVGAFAAAAAYATMGQVLQLGRVGESDALLTLCLSSALFAWHYGYACRANPRWAWTAGYTLAALAALAKGPQGPIYFVAVTTVYLAWQRDWKFLFSSWHLAGLGLFALILGAWQLPFFLTLDPAKTQAIWSEGGQLSERFHYTSVRHVLRHLSYYPLEVWASMLPWSFLLPALASAWFRQNLGRARPMAVFLLTVCVVTFPTCWLPALSRPRYFMSIYPCLAVVIGLIVERSWASRQIGWWQCSWDRYLVTGVVLIGGAGLSVVAVRLWGDALLHGLEKSISVTFAFVYALAACVAVMAMLWSRRQRDTLHAQVGVLSIAAFMGLTYTGLVISAQVQTSNDPSSAVVAVRDMIPPGERLVSLGPVHHLFAYYYQQKIELRKISKSKPLNGMDNTYFCFTEDPGYPNPKISFAWERVMEISCERAQSPHPRSKVVVGKSLERSADIGHVSQKP